MTTPPTDARRATLPSGTWPVGIGLVVNGLASYAFLVVSARHLGPEAYGGLAVLWAAVFLIGPGLFVPIEQELGRLLSGRAALGLGAGPVVRRAAVLGAAPAAVILVAAAVLAPLVAETLFDGDALLYAGLMVGIVGYYVASLAKGTLAGTRHFGRYGVYLGGDSLLRLGICVGCVVAGVATAGPFGLALGIAPILAVVPAFWGTRSFASPGPPVAWRDLTTSLGALLAASLLAQVLVNAPPLLFEVLEEPTGSPDALTVGAFTAALILARVPFFLFQAVQAALLPSLAALAAQRRFQELRRGMVRLVLLVGGLAGLGAVAAFAFGGEVVALVFGGDFEVPDRTVGILALGSAAYLVAMALSQALIALDALRAVALGWLAGVVAALVATFALPGGSGAVEVGYLLGCATAMMAMAAALRQVWSGGDHHDSADGGPGQRNRLASDQ